MSRTFNCRRAGCFAFAVALPLSIMGLPGVANAAVGAPKDLSVSTVGASTPVLSWSPAPKATEYQVQVDNDPGFGSPEHSVTTKNNNAVPSKNLRPGIAYWRVRATAGKDSSDWVRGEFAVGAADVPAPTQPATGANLSQPGSPPLLRWTTSRGALSYIVEVDADADFVGAKQYTTHSTSLVVPDPLGEGDWFWRVTADKGEGITSRPSGVSSFNILGLPAPVLTSPNSTFEEPIEDVVLDWEPVEGAQSYDLQVALDETFNNLAIDATGIRGTRYSPPVTLNSDEFWWRVRATDTAGLPTPWQKSRFDFKRVYPDTPTPRWPLGTNAAPGIQGVDTTYFQWDPVQHASMYELEIATSPTFSTETKFAGCISSSTRGMLTPATTLVPRFTGRNNDCVIPAGTLSTDQAYWWHVRPLDMPYDRSGLAGDAWSQPQAFKRVARPARSGSAPADWLKHKATGLKVAMSGTGLQHPQQGCVSQPSVGFPDSGSYTRPSVCVGMSGTPVFSWDRQPNMDYYVVWFAQNENFTTTEVQPIVTSNTMLAIDTRKASGDPIQLPDQQANRPYYWVVQPCRIDEDCSPSPRSQDPGVSGAAAFQKASPAITGLTASDPAGNDISFSWADYHDVNQNTWSYNERGIQSAQTYHIVVDNEPGFSEPYLDEATVDQTVYTSPSKLYPEGKLFWRVQAIDTQGNPLTWSSPAELIKSSPPVALRSPLGGGAVSGSTPLEWGALAFATSYVVEVYRNGDLSFSEANQVLSTTTRNASYAPSVPFPADATPYVWRVRRIDPSRNPGPWSATGSFVSLGAAPELLGPRSGTMHRGNDLVLFWSDVPGAASYEVIGASSAGGRFVTKTVASAYAPSLVADGSWTWSVRALDSAGKNLGTSAVASFRVDGTAPTLVKIKGTKLTNKKKAKIVATFSERVQGVSKRTMRLYKKGSKKALKTKVVVKGSRAILKPKVKLKRGKSYFIKWKTGIRDGAGNALVKPKKWQVEVR